MSMSKQNVSVDGMKNDGYARNVVRPSSIGELFHRHANQFEQIVATVSCVCMFFRRPCLSDRAVAFGILFLLLQSDVWSMDDDE
jgi:hypothetical protein